MFGDGQRLSHLAVQGFLSGTILSLILLKVRVAPANLDRVLISWFLPATLLLLLFSMC